MDEKNLRVLYEGLKANNPGMPSYEQFKIDMSNDSVLQSLYEKLKTKNPELPDFGQFKVDLFGDTDKKKVPSSTDYSSVWAGSSEDGSQKAPFDWAKTGQNAPAESSQESNLITPVLDKGISPTLTVGGKKGHFNFDVPPEEGGTPGKRYAFDTEDGGRWFYQLEKDYQGGRWEEASHAADDYARYQQLYKDNPEELKKKAKDMWGDSPVGDVLYKNVSEGKTFDQLKENLKGLDTWRQISNGEPGSQKYVQTKEGEPATMARPKNPDFKLPESNLSQFDVNSPTYKRLATYNDFLSANPDQSKNHLSVVFENDPVMEDPLELFNSQRVLKKYANDPEAIKDGDVLFIINPNAQLSENNLVIPDGENTFTAVGQVAIDKESGKQYFIYYDPYEKKEMAMNLTEALMRGGGFLGGTPDTYKPENFFADPEQWMQESNRYKDVIDRYSEYKFRAMDAKSAGRKEWEAPPGTIQTTGKSGYDPGAVIPDVANRVPEEPWLKDTWFDDNAPDWLLKGLSETSVGIATELVNGRPTFDLSNYEEKWWTEIMSGAVSILADPLMYVPIPGIAQLGGKLGLKAYQAAYKANLLKFGAKHYEKLLAKGMTEEMASQVIAKGVADASGRWFRIGARMGSNSATLGLYNTNMSVLHDLKEADGNWSELNIQTLKNAGYEGLVGITLGAATGFVGGYGGELAGRATGKMESGIAKTGTKAGIIAGTLGVEGTIFTYGQAGLTGRPLSEISAYDVGAMVATLGILKGFHSVAGNAYKKAKGQFNKSENFTPDKANKDQFRVGLTVEEIDAINRSLSDQGVKTISRNSDDVINGIIDRSMKKGQEPVIDEIKGILQDPEVPMSAKAKLAWSLAGVDTYFDYDIQRFNVRTGEDGKTIVDLRNGKGELLSTKYFNTKDEADQFVGNVAMTVVEVQKMNKFAGLSEIEKAQIVSILGTKGIPKEAIEQAWKTPIGYRTPEQQQMMDVLHQETEAFTSKKLKEKPEETPKPQPAPEPTPEPTPKPTEVPPAPAPEPKPEPKPEPTPEPTPVKERKVEEVMDLAKPLEEEPKEIQEKVQQAVEAEKKGSELFDEAYTYPEESQERIDLLAQSKKFADQAEALRKEVRISRVPMLKALPIVQKAEETRTLAIRSLNELKTKFKTNEWVEGMPITQQEFTNLDDAQKLIWQRLQESTTNKELEDQINIVNQIVPKIKGEQPSAPAPAPESKMPDETFGKAEGVDTPEPTVDVSGRKIPTPEEWSKMSDEEKEPYKNTITKEVTTYDGRKVPVDYNLAPTLERLWGMGYKTLFSDSGTKSDHPGNRYVSGDKENKMIGDQAYLTFLKPEAHESIAEHRNTQEQIDNIIKAAKDAGLFTMDAEALWDQPSLRLSFPKYKSGKAYHEINREAIEIMKQKFPDLGVGKPDFDRYLEEKEKVFKELVSKQGGELDLTDRQIVDLWKKFTDALEKYTKGGTQDATGIRKDEGRIYPGGDVSKGGQEEGGPDLQRPEKAWPETGYEARRVGGQVTPEETEFARGLFSPDKLSPEASELLYGLGMADRETPFIVRQKDSFPPEAGEELVKKGLLHEPTWKNTGKARLSDEGRKLFEQRISEPVKPAEEKPTPTGKPFAEMTRDEFVKVKIEDFIARSGEWNNYGQDTKDKITKDLEAQYEKEYEDALGDAFIKGEKIARKPQWAMIYQEWKDFAGEKAGTLEGYIDMVQKAIESLKPVTNDIREELKKALHEITPEPGPINPPDDIKGRDRMVHYLKVASESGYLKSVIPGKENMTDDEMNAFMEVLDANAKVWADVTGGTVDQYYDNYIKEVRLVKNDEGSYSLFQSEGSDAASYFYSNVGKALDLIGQDIALGSQWLAMILNNGGKKTELEWLGLDQLLDPMKKYSKDDIRNLINDYRVRVLSVSSFGKSQQWNDLKTRHNDYSHEFDFYNHKRGRMRIHKVVFTFSKDYDWNWGDFTEDQVRKFKSDIYKKVTDFETKHPTKYEKTVKEMLINFLENRKDPTSIYYHSDDAIVKLLLDVGLTFEEIPFLLMNSVRDWEVQFKQPVGFGDDQRITIVPLPWQSVFVMRTLPAERDFTNPVYDYKISFGGDLPDHHLQENQMSVIKQLFPEEFEHHQSSTKWDKFNEPGGTDYEEIRLTIPHLKRPVMPKGWSMKFDADFTLSHWNHLFTKDEIEKRGIEYKPQGEYKNLDPNAVLDLINYLHSISPGSGTFLKEPMLFFRTEFIKEGGIGKPEVGGSIPWGPFHNINSAIVKWNDRFRFQNSVHFDDQNYFAHLRIDTRWTSNKKRVLRIAELQGDWPDKIRDWEHLTDKESLTSGEVHFWSGSAQFERTANEYNPKLNFKGSIGKNNMEYYIIRYTHDVASKNEIMLGITPVKNVEIYTVDEFHQKCRDGFDSSKDVYESVGFQRGEIKEQVLDRIKVMTKDPHTGKLKMTGLWDWSYSPFDLLASVYSGMGMIPSYMRAEYKRGNSVISQTVNIIGSFMKDTSDPVAIIDYLLTFPNVVNDADGFGDFMKKITNYPGAAERMMPFYRNWNEVALKYALKYAVDLGLDGIVWDSGEVQKTRWSQNQVTNKIFYYPKANGNFQVIYKDSAGYTHSTEMAWYSIKRTFGATVQNKMLNKQYPFAQKDKDFIWDPENAGTLVGGQLHPITSETRFSRIRPGRENVDYSTIIDDHNDAHINGFTGNPETSPTGFIDPTDWVTSNVRIIEGDDLAGDPGNINFYGSVIQDKVGSMFRFLFEDKNGRTGKGFLKDYGNPPMNVFKVDMPAKKQWVTPEQMEDDWSWSYLHGFEITPEMRDMLREKQLPLFQKNTPDTGKIDPNIQRKIDMAKGIRPKDIYSYTYYHPELTKSVMKEAQTWYGVTDEVDKAGFITLDGKMLNFVGPKQYIKGADVKSLAHENVLVFMKKKFPELGQKMQTALEAGYFPDQPEIMFMNLGNIRMNTVMGWYVEMTTIPTEQQFETLKTVVKRGIEFMRTGKQTAYFTINVRTLELEMMRSDKRIAITYNPEVTWPKVHSDIIQFFTDGFVNRGTGISGIQYYQVENGAKKGAFRWLDENKALIGLWNGADLSTLIHEITGHLGKRVLYDLAKVDEQFAKDAKTIEKWLGEKDENWSTQSEEKYARAWERFLREGKTAIDALKRVFKQLSDWLAKIYKTISGSPIDVDIPPEVREVFERLLNADRRKGAKPGVESVGTRRGKTMVRVQEGKDTKIRMPDKSVRNARFAIIEMDDLLPSHDPMSFNDTEDYPREKGQNVNPRNYKGDPTYQMEVDNNARDLDPMEVINTTPNPASGPPIITIDGYVVSGNGRTMSIKRAAELYPDRYDDYLAFLMDELATFGFTTGDIEKFNRPVLVKIDNDFGDYYTINALDQYNKESMKGESPMDKLIKLSSIIKSYPDVMNRIMEIVGNYDDMSSLKASTRDVKLIKELLLNNNILLSNEIMEYFTGNEFTQKGFDLFQDILIGIVLDPKTIRISNIEGVKQFRRNIVNAIPALNKNYQLGEFSLEDEINDAILLQAEFAQSGAGNFYDFVTQLNMMSKPTAEAILMNRAINLGQNVFKKFIQAYNTTAETSKEGGGLFGGGEVLSKSEILEKYVMETMQSRFKANDFERLRRAIDNARTAEMATGGTTGRKPRGRKGGKKPGTGLGPVKVTPEAPKEPEGDMRRVWYEMENLTDRDMFKKIDFPEMLEMFMGFTGGESPVINHKMAASMLGRFKGISKGYIELNANLMSMDMKMIELVFAHEFGHMMDWLPEKTLGTERTRNILARIASLRRYTEDLLAEKPGMSPVVISPQDRARLKKEAKRLLKEEYDRGIREIVQEVIEEEPIFAGITADDILEIWRTNTARDVMPDLYDYIAQLSAAEKKEIVRQAMRGIVNTDIGQRFARQVGTRTIRRTVVTRIVPDPVTHEKIMEKFGELLRAEIIKRRAFSREQIMQELIDLTKWWEPWNNYNDPLFARYAFSSAELYANSISVLFNNPEALRTRAPMFWRAFMNYFEKKPQFKDVYEEMQQIYRTMPRDEILKRRYEVYLKRAERARTLRMDIAEQSGKQFDYDKLVKSKNKAVRAVENWKWRFLRQYISMNMPIYRAIPFKKWGANITDQQLMRNHLEGKAMMNEQVGLFILRVEKEVIDPLAKVGVDLVKFSFILEMERNLTQRLNVANPAGLMKDYAQEMQEWIYRQFTPEVARAVDQAKKKFHEMFWKLVEEAVKVGIYSEAYKERVLAPWKDYYVTYSIIDYIWKNHISVKNFPVKGTFKDVAPVFLETMLKAASLIREIEYQKAVLGFMDIWETHFPGDIIPARRISKTSFKPEPGKVLVTYWKNNIKAGFYADPYIAEVFKQYEPHEINAILGVLRSVFQVFRPLVTTFNISWALYSNMMRDNPRTIVNLFTIIASTGGSKQKLRAAGMPFEYTARWFASLPKSYHYVMGHLRPLLEEMIEQKTLPRAFFGTYDYAVQHHLDPLLIKSGLVAKKKGPWQMIEKIPPIWVIKQGLSGLAWAGSILEANSKITAYQIYKDLFNDKQLAAFYTRNYAGTPNYTDKATSTPETNALFAFANVIAQALRTDAGIAVKPQTRGAWWWSALTALVLPAWAIAMAALGFFGENLRKKYQKIPEYDKTNYLCLVVGEREETGAVQYLRIPLPDVHRFIYAVAYKSAMATGGELQSPLQVLDVSSSLLPTLNPAIKIGQAWVDYAQGVNPYDRWYNTEIIDEDLFLAGTNYSFPEMVKWTINSFGGRWIIKLSVFDPTKQTWEEYVYGTIPAVNRAYKETRAGEMEVYARSQKEEDKKNAIKRIKQREYLENLADEAAADNIDPRKAGAFDVYFNRMLKEYFGGKLKSEQESKDFETMRNYFKLYVQKGRVSPRTKFLTALETWKDTDVRLNNTLKYFYVNGYTETIEALDDAIGYGFISGEFYNRAKTEVKKAEQFLNDLNNGNVNKK